MMMAKMAKNAITMRNDIDVRSRDPHVPRLLRFLPLLFDDELLDFFDESFEYMFSALGEVTAVSNSHINLRGVGRLTLTRPWQSSACYFVVVVVVPA